MKPITLFEYGTSKEWRPEEIDLLHIEHLNERMGGEILSIHYRKGSPIIRANSYVGVIKFGRKAIQILPKVDNDNEKLATQNLLYLLSYTRKLNVKETEIAELTEKEADFFEILIYLYAKNLLEIMRKGVHKEYVTIEENAGFLKGKWLVSQQLARSPTNKLKFFIAYDEFTEDNLLNRIFKHTTYLLQRLSNNPRNQQLLQELSFVLGDIEFETIQKVHFDKLNLNRLNLHYKPVVELARLFILNLSIQMMASDIKTFSFVFDMNKLFEEFVYEFIRRNKEEILPEDLKDCSIISQYGTKYLVYSNGSEGCYNLRPDIIFMMKDREIPIVIDTKYKIIDKDDKVAASTADMYQMYAYGEKYNSDKVILVYPENIREIRESYHTLSNDVDGKSRKIQLMTINIKRDLRREKSNLTQEFKTILEI